MTSVSIAKRFSGAVCIWHRNLVGAYNCHLRFRRTFHLSELPAIAELLISAGDKYRLFVNGHYVEEGPARAERGMCYVDCMSHEDLPLRPGRNILAVVSQNKNLAEHGQPPKPGAFVLSLRLQYADGSKVVIGTDSSWKVSIPPEYQKPAPRRFFPVGFNDWIDFRNAEPDWIADDYDDSAWSYAAEVSDLQMNDAHERPIPRFAYNFLPPNRLLRHGQVGPLDGILGVSFLHLAEPLPGDELRLRTFVFSETARDDVYLYPSCDNESRFILNGKTAWEQGAGDHGFRNHLADYEEAWYSGMFHGHGLCFEPTDGHRERAACRLEPGWNELVIEMRFADKASGVALVFLERESHRRVSVGASADRSPNDVNTWRWKRLDAGEAEPWHQISTDPADIRLYLEPSHLAFWDEPAEVGVHPEAQCDGTFELHEGSFVDLELEDYGVGFLEFDLEGPAGSVVDIAISERIDPETQGVLWINNGLSQGERLVLSGNRDQWRPLERRAGQYLALIIRKAKGVIRVTRCGIRNQRYPAARLGQFHSSDLVFNWMWTTGAKTVELATFDVSEDCPTREMGQWSGDAFIRTQLLAGLWGDMAISTKAIREFAADQGTGGWARAMVPAGYGDCIVDYALLLPVWIWNHYRLTGDIGLVRETFKGVENLFTVVRSEQDARGYVVPKDRDREHVYIDFTLVTSVRRLPVVAALQAYLHNAFVHAAKLADLIDRPADARAWREEAACLRAAIHRDFWSDSSGLFVDGEDADGRAVDRVGAVTNYKMLWGGVADAYQESRILAALFPEPKCENLDLWINGEGVYVKHFATEVLCERGLWQQAFTALRGYYGSMMTLNRTIPEIWDRSWATKLPEGSGATPSPDSQLSGMAVKSLVHPFGIGPIWHLVHSVCGLKPAQAGYDTLLWEPMPGDLQTIEAKIPVPDRSGWLEVHMTRHTDSGNRYLRLMAPDYMTVEISRRYLDSGDTVEVGRGHE